MADPAKPQVRQVAFYWRNKKAVTANQVEIDFTMPREPLYGQEGILAYSQGQTKMKIVARGFTPVGGSFTSNDIESILAQKDITASFVLGGKFYREDYAVTNLRYTSDTEKGTTVEEVTLEGATPRITG